MNVVMLWLRVAAWLVVWLVVRDLVAAREVLGHRRCAGWLGGDGGDTLRSLLGCGAGLLPFAQTRFAQTVRLVAAAILTSLTGAPLTSPPAACLPSPEIQSERSQRVAS
mgnify:CR=1 FL=1